MSDNQITKAYHFEPFAMTLSSFSKYLVKLPPCFGIVNINFWIFCGVFDYVLF